MLENYDFAFAPAELEAFLQEKFPLEGAGDFGPFIAKGFYDDEGGETPFTRLTKELKVSDNTFHKKYIDPIKDLSKEQVRQWVSVLNFHLGITHHLHLEVSTVNLYEALQWTVLNVLDLNLPVEILPKEPSEQTKNRPVQIDLAAGNLLSALFLSKKHLRPYRQCHYCGRLNVDKRDRPFGKQGRKICHVQDCPANGNGSEHPEGCCFKAWQRITKNFRTHCRNEPDNLRKVFRSFLEARFTANLKQTTHIRFRYGKPMIRRHWFDIGIG